MTTVGEILDMLETKAPVQYKLDFDNVGLLVGRRSAPVRSVLLSLDITDRVIQEAAEGDVQLIVSHHPLFFSLHEISDASWEGSRALLLAEKGIAAICMHTNLDAARGGVNDVLLGSLGLRFTAPLDESTMIGRIGELPNDITTGEFLQIVKTALHTNGLRYYDAGRPVKKVAVCGGSGGGEVALAIDAGCDTYVTADIKYDPFLLAEHRGINLIDADHFCTENVVIPVLQKWITEAFPAIMTRISEAHGQVIRFY